MKRIRKLKVLLGCYACDPYQGSEPGMGWAFVSNIARFHEVHAIVEEGGYKNVLLRFAQEYPERVKNITFHFVPREHHNVLRKIWPPSYYWFYRQWQKRVYEYAKKLVEYENFDLVHQVNLAGYREPGYLWKLGKPFIWGPLGGLNQTAWKLLPMLGVHGIVFFGLRNMINALQMRYSSNVLLAARHAKTIFISDRAGATVVKRIWRREPEYMCEIGCRADSFARDIQKHVSGTPLRICWAGNFLPLKALQFLLHALMYVKNPVMVEVLGAGVMWKKWTDLAHSLKVDEKVHFNGMVSRSKVLEVMSTCHVMCMTTIHEGGTGTVTLEALQNALPIIALDHCAFAAVINENCGIKVPLGKYEDIVRQLALSIDMLAENEELRQKLARGAIERAKEFTWERKMSQLNECYMKAVDEKS